MNRFIFYVFICNNIPDRKKGNIEMERLSTFIAMEESELMQSIKFNLEKSNDFIVKGIASNGTDQHE